MRKFTDHGDPLRDLWIEIVRKGDVETLLTLIPSFPALVRNEKEDPVAFWKNAFELYFPEYIGIFDEFVENDWKKICLWLTFAHRCLLRQLVSDYAIEGIPTKKKYLGLVEMQGKLDTLRIVWKGNVKFIRNWLKEDLNVPSGQLFKAFEFNNNITDQTTFENITSNLICKALFNEFALLFQEFDMTRLFQTYKVLDDKWELFFRTNMPLTMRLIFYFLWQSVMQRNQSEHSAFIFKKIPSSPAIALKSKELYLGKCIHCKKAVFAK